LPDQWTPGGDPIHSSLQVGLIGPSCPDSIAIAPHCIYAASRFLHTIACVHIYAYIYSLAVLTALLYQLHIFYILHNSRTGGKTVTRPLDQTIAVARTAVISFAGNSAVPKVQPFAGECLHSSDLDCDSTRRSFIDRALPRRSSLSKYDALRYGKMTTASGTRRTETPTVLEKNSFSRPPFRSEDSTSLIGPDPSHSQCFPGMLGEHT